MKGEGGDVRSGRGHLPKQPRALRSRRGRRSSGGGRGRRARRSGSGAVLALGRGRGLRGGDGRARAHGGGSSTLARHVADEVVDGGVVGGWLRSTCGRCG